MPYSKGVVHQHKGRGRPKGFKGIAKKIAKETRNGDELVEFALAVKRDERLEMKWRIEAAKLLWDRGFGRVLTSDELEDALNEVPSKKGSSLNFAVLDGMQRAQLREIIQRLRGDAREVARTPTGTELHLMDGGVVVPLHGITDEESDEEGGDH